MKTLLPALTNRIAEVEKFHHLLIWTAQPVIFALSGIAAFLLRFDGSIPTVHLVHLAHALPIWLVLKAIVFRMCGLDRGWWRFVSVNDVVRIGVGNLLGSFGGAVCIALLVPPGFPRSIYFLDCLICFLATAGVRVCARIVQESVENGCKQGVCKRVVIYGAGAAGVMLLREIRSSPALHYRVCGFVDDRSQKKGLLIQGSGVLGTGSDLAQIVRKQQIDEVLIAIPSASGGRMAQLLRYCHQAGVRCRTIPTLAQTIEGRGLASQIRDVAVEDLLGRTPVHLNDGEIRVWLKGKVVAVTGAAGSIGSELCRQITRFQPGAIVGFDIAETALFYLHREMQRSSPDVPFHAEIGSIQSRRRLAEIFRQYSPSIVYHAAAYKHVPMMEGHLFEALENNVFGTYNVAMAAAEHGVEDFVMISSDKAVRPTSIMGATKRLAELLILSLQDGGTKFVAVRFGNVLGSNGSVIPVFKQQIAVGGPVTVTHPEMRRYFMTIPEACQLVLQASAMGKAGEIFVLNMGDPVKIVELARNLILLSGLRPDEDIPIEFTGVRPGEKLYEELNLFDEDTLPTSHEKIRIFAGNGLPAGNMAAYLENLRRLCASGDARNLILTLKEILPDYNPSAFVLRRLVAGEERPVAITAA